MSESCNHNCGSCSQNCEDRKSPEDKPLESTKVKKIIGIVSGKGGVGKSSVTSMLAVAMNKKHHSVGILDADVTGPSIPKAFGVTAKAQTDGEGIIPGKTELGIDIMSINLLLENDTDPVVWRGPMIAGAVKQFWTDVKWGEKDFLFVDMPPGTGDVPLTVFQSLPIDGIVIVTSPQELVGMVVEKAAKMAQMMNVPVLGIVENMSYFKCPDCGSAHEIFGTSRISEVAKNLSIDEVSKLPMEARIAAACDTGRIEEIEMKPLDNIVKSLEML